MMNATNYNSSVLAAVPCAMDQKTEFGRIMKILFYCVLVVAALVGNTLTIAIVYRDKKLRNTVNALIVNMAVSDLLVPLSIPKLIVQEVLQSTRWNVGGTVGMVLCKGFHFMADISQPVSILSIMFMSLDRFGAIVFPLRLGSSGPKITATFVIASWAIPVAFFAPYFYSFRLHHSASGELRCISHWGENHLQSYTVYTTLLCIIFILIPFVLLVFCYSVILRVLRRQDQGTVARCQSRREQRIRYKKTKKVVLMALAIVVVFGVCYGPYNALLFAWTFIWKWQRSPKFCGWGTFFFIARFLSLSNPAINPVIYFIFIERFGAGLRAMWCSRMRKSRTGSTGREGTGTTASRHTRLASYRLSPIGSQNEKETIPLSPQNVKKAEHPAHNALLPGQRPRGIHD